MKRASAVFREFEVCDVHVGMARFRLWFFAAAIYNLAWGGITLLFPRLLFEVTGMAQPNYIVLWQCIGMFVLVYAPGYWWAANDPFRFRHLILVGFLGKICGPAGYLWFAATGALPAVFGWTILTNDLVWLPVFYLFLNEAAARTGGWFQLLRGM